MSLAILRRARMCSGTAMVDGSRLLEGVIASGFMFLSSASANG